MSVRVPYRPGPESPPRISTPTCLRPPHGSTSLTSLGAVAVRLPVNTEVTRSRWVAAYRTACTTGTATRTHSAQTNTAPPTRRRRGISIGRTIRYVVRTTKAHTANATGSATENTISRDGSTASATSESKSLA